MLSSSISPGYHLAPSVFTLILLSLICWANAASFCCLWGPQDYLQLDQIFFCNGWPFSKWPYLYKNQKTISLSLVTCSFLHLPPLLRGCCKAFGSRFIIKDISFYFYSSLSFVLKPSWSPRQMHQPVPSDFLASWYRPRCQQGHPNPRFTPTYLDSSLRILFLTPLPTAASNRSLAFQVLNTWI